MTESREAILVLGMHRSGTSAVARVLNLLGGAISEDLLPADAYNETGYWESEELMRVHQEIFLSYGHDWHHAHSLPPGWWLANGHQRYRDEILGILERDFGDIQLFVVKDPRVSLLVPLWLEVLERFDAKPRFVLALRSPLEVAASLGRAHGLSASRSHLLWLRYVLEGERWSRGFPRAIVIYDRLLEDWRSLMPATFEALRVDWPNSFEQRAMAVDEFLSPAHRHHSASSEDLDARADVPVWVKTTYRAMQGLVEGRTKESLAALDAVHQQLEAADAAFSAELADGLEFHRLGNESARLARELATARAEGEAVREDLEAARAEIEEMLSSRSWRLTAPRRRLRQGLWPAKRDDNDN